MVPDQYNLKNLAKACRNPYMFVQEIQKIAWETLGSRISERTFVGEHGHGVDVMGKDWDNLIILDACRYDHFTEYNSIEGHLTHVISNGSTSQEFMRKNFSGEDLHDTIYVTSNPHCEKIEKGTFYMLKKTYGSDADSGYSGASPEIVTETATETYEKYPDKRLIVHYMQPHAPYLGSYADELREQVRREHGLSFDYMKRIRGEGVFKEEDDYILDLREAARLGYITDDQLERAHTENLELVSDHVKELLGNLNGKSVVTSDHGELLGRSTYSSFNFLAPRYKKYGHPGGVYIPELRIVPWLEIESDQRRDIIREDPLGEDNVDKSAVEDQLRALGYV